MIVIKGATEHHLKNINVTIPKNTLTVVTGVSGSGKSTLLFDVLAKEANRQYMEATGEKLEMVSPPKVNQIIGLAPCITIGQEGNNTNPRSTIGTFTNIYTKLRLSGGEAQRLKIATELMTKQAKPTIYLMDEPTTGLHPRDIDTLMVCIKALIQAGHTVIAIEHHLDFIRMSDYVIEIGPYAGDLGGELIATGTPKDIKIQGIGVTAPLL